MIDKIASIINTANSIVIIQADNPDGDSLASSLALEQILAELGKDVHMYCGVDMPSYLRYLPGWDRVSKDLPQTFAASIIVDTSAITLLEQAQKTGSLQWLKTKPCIVLDHHVSAVPSIDFATVTYVQPAVSTGEIIYELSNTFGWKRNNMANDMIMTSIMSDSLGLTTDGTSSRSIAIVSELVEQGVSIPAIENKRRAMQKKSQSLVAYKAELLGRIEYSDDGRIAYVHIPWAEIERYSPEYNPSMLVMDEMRQVTGVELAIGFKSYPDGRITGKIRANYGSAVADKIASAFNGGGHPYAAGFRVLPGKPFNEVKAECLTVATELLDTLKAAQDTDDETTQYAYTIS